MPVRETADERPVQFQYLGLAEHRLSPYLPTWDYQREIHARVASGEIPPQVLFVEHEPVYTAGRRTEPHERPFDGTPVVDVDRGGKITWHGPGQLVGYPIVFLPRHIGVVDYVRRVEEALIRVLSDYGVHTGRVDGRTGVWLRPSDGRPERKIAAIGIRVSKQTTMHGFALNVTSQLSGFDNIVPCGIADAGVTSLAAELDAAPPTLTEVAEALKPHLSDLLALQPYQRLPEFTTTEPPTVSAGVSVLTL